MARLEAEPKPENVIGEIDFDDPTPKEILLRRAEVHRLKGEANIAEWLEQEAGGGCKSSADDTEADSPLDQTLSQHGFDEWTCEVLLRHGVWYVGQLVEWTAPMLMLLNGMDGAKCGEIINRLTSAGLTLRVPNAGETAKLPKRRGENELERLAKRQQGTSQFLRKKIIELWDQGVSYREISKRFGFKSHGQVWSAIQDETRRRAAASLRRRIGKQPWLIAVSAEKQNKDTSRWQLVVHVERGQRDHLRGIDTWERRPVQVVERERNEQNRAT